VLVLGGDEVVSASMGTGASRNSTNDCRSSPAHVEKKKRRKKRPTFKFPVGDGKSEKL
jgi:hypothetical protein